MSLSGTSYGEIDVGFSPNIGGMLDGLQFIKPYVNLRLGRSMRNKTHCIRSFPPGPSLADIDLRLLRVFHAIVRCNGFSAAQYELQMSQSAISAHMKQLEERLGIHLCERGRSGFKLTSGGEAVYYALQKLFQSVREFKSDLADFKQQLAGEIFIAIDDATATNPDSPFTNMLQRLTLEAPNVEIHLSVAPPAVLETGIIEDRYHLVVGPFREVADSLDRYEIYEETEALYCGRNHPLSERASEVSDVRELNGFRYVERGYMDRSQIFTDVEFSQKAYASNMEVLIALLLTGEYIGFAPRHYAKLWVSSGKLVPIGGDCLTYRSHYRAVMRKAQDLPAARFALGCLRERQEG